MIILYIGARIIASHTILIFGRRKKWSSKAVKTFWLFNRNEKIWATSNNSQMSIHSWFSIRGQKGLFLSSNQPGQILDELAAREEEEVQTATKKCRTNGNSWMIENPFDFLLLFVRFFSIQRAQNAHQHITLLWFSLLVRVEAVIDQSFC